MRKTICPYCKNKQYTRIEKSPAYQQGGKNEYYYQAACDGCGARGPIDKNKIAAASAFEEGHD